MKKVFNKVTISLFLLLVIVIAAVLFLVHRHATQQPPHPGTAASTHLANGTKSTSSNGSTSPAASQGGSDKPITPPSGGTVASPTGNFVSNHHPSLSRASAATLEQSVCSTSPGAACKLEFAKDGVTKSLPAKTADASGNVLWNWQPSDIGLSVGTWQVTAIASLGGQTKTATDPLALEVSP